VAIKTMIQEEYSAKMKEKNKLKKKVMLLNRQSILEKYNFYRTDH